MLGDNQFEQSKALSNTQQLVKQIPRASSFPDILAHKWKCISHRRGRKKTDRVIFFLFSFLSLPGLLRLCSLFHFCLLALWRFHVNIYIVAIIHDLVEWRVSQHLKWTYTDIHTNTKRAIQIPYNRFRTNHVHVTVAFRKISTRWFHFENWYRNNHQWWCIIRMVKRICKNMSNNCKGRCRSLVYRLAHTSDHSSALPNSIHTPNFSNVVKDGVK